MIEPLNNLFKEPVEYRTYRLERFDSRYNASTARPVNGYQKKLDLRR